MISSCSMCTSIDSLYTAVYFFLITHLGLFCADACPKCSFIFQVCAVLSCSASNLLMWDMEVPTCTLTPKPHQSRQCKCVQELLSLNSLQMIARLLFTCDSVRNRWHDRILSCNVRTISNIWFQTSSSKILSSKSFLQLVATILRHWWLIVTKHSCAWRSWNRCYCGALYR